LLLATPAFALETPAAVAWLMGVSVAISAAVVAEAATIASAAGDVARIVLRALTVAVAELLLPAFAAAAGGVVLLLAGTGLEALWLRCLRSG